MYKIGKEVFKFLFFFSLTAFLFWLVYRDQNWEQLIWALRNEVNYFWIWVSIILGILSHILRALRWQLVTASMNYHISLANSFMGVMIGYFANMAIPRMGEFTRCAVVNKYEKVPYSNLLGTVVTERVIDVIILLFLTLLVIVGQFKEIVLFFKENEEIVTKVEQLRHSYWILFVLILFVIGLIVLCKYLLRSRLGDRIKHFLLGLKEGLISVKNVKQPGLFIFYSLAIWFLYYLMLYLCFFCFNFTSHLSPMVGLTVFVLSSYGMVAPVQGGIGAWHFMVIAALLVYLPHTQEIESMAKTFALLTHGTMTLLYIVLGVLCLLVLPFYNNWRAKYLRKKSHYKKNKNEYC